MWVEHGEKLVFLEAQWKVVGEASSGYSLKSHQYIRLQVRMRRQYMAPGALSVCVSYARSAVCWHKTQTLVCSVNMCRPAETGWPHVNLHACCHDSVSICQITQNPRQVIGPWFAPLLI